MTLLTRTLPLAILLLTHSVAHAGTFNLIAQLTAGHLAALSTGPSYTVVGSASNVTSVGGGVAQIPAGLFPASFSGPISPPASGVDAFSVVGGGLPAGTLDAAAASNFLPLQGTYIAKAGNNPAGTIAQAPIGGGGSANGIILGIFPATVIGEPWQLGVHTAIGTGLAAGTAMLTGFDHRTASGAGVVQFVSPHTTTIAAIPTTIPSGSILTLTYVAVPEPTAVGLALAVALVMGAGLRRQ